MPALALLCSFQSCRSIQWQEECLVILACRYQIPPDFADARLLRLVPLLSLQIFVIYSAGSKLEAALIANAVKLSKNAAAGLPETWALVQVEFAATNFSSFSAAAAPSIHKFLQQATKNSSSLEQSQASTRPPDIASTAAAAVKSITTHRHPQAGARSADLASTKHAVVMRSATHQQPRADAGPADIANTATHQQPQALTRPADIASTAVAAARPQAPSFSQVSVSSMNHIDGEPQKLQDATASGRDDPQEAATAGVSAHWSSAQPAKECNDQSTAEVSEDYTRVDIEQQRQLLRDIQVRSKLLRVQSTSQIGSKRPHSSSNYKVFAKQSKGEHTTGPGQRTITSLFAKGQ